MTPRLRWLILGVALAGLAAAGASAWVHYQLLTNPSYVSPCDIDTTFNCSQVYLSRYGSVGGVSVALPGVLWFGLVALIAALARSDGQKSVAGAYLMVIGTTGLAVCLYLAYISLAVLRTGCVLCLATYVCVAAVVVLASRVSSIRLSELPGRIGRDVAALGARGSTLAAAALYVFGAVALVTYFPRESVMAADPGPAAAPSSSTAPGEAPGVSADQQKSFADAWAKQPRVDLGIAAEGARVVIVKFNDFACNGCAVAYRFYKPIFDRLAKSHPGAIKLVVKDWPWDTSCNFNAPSTIPGHNAACLAAGAARMAQDRGKYAEMEAWLFSHQPATADEIRKQAATMLGVTDFDREYALTLPGIRRDVADGGALGVRSTPTFFINGVRIDDGIMQPALFETAINLELQK